MTTSTSIVKFSDSAILELSKLYDKEFSKEKPYLRIGVKNGGCSGFSYIFEFDEKHENDIEDQIGHVNIIIDPTQAEKILNLEIDYQSGLNNRGFTFHNPNAKTTCGCGTSFS